MSVENVMPDPTTRPECDPYSAGREERLTLAAQPGSGEVVDTKLIHEHAEGLRHNALIFRDNNQRSRERQLYAAALAINIAGDEIDRLRDQLTAAQQRIADLHAALRTYGWHKPECDYMQESLPCTCGFMDAGKEQGNG